VIESRLSRQDPASREKKEQSVSYETHSCPSGSKSILPAKDNRTTESGSIPKNSNLLLPPPCNSAAELKVKLQTRIASDFKVSFDDVSILVRF
jgi:hypothetical protein